MISYNIIQVLLLFNTAQLLCEYHLTTSIIISIIVVHFHIVSYQLMLLLTYHQFIVRCTRVVDPSHFTFQNTNGKHNQVVVVNAWCNHRHH